MWADEPDIDRQHPKLRQHFEHALFSAERHRHDHQIDAGLARELDEVGNAAKLGHACHRLRRALVVAVVENAEQADVGAGALVDRLDQHFGIVATADDDRAPLQPALPRPLQDDAAQRHPEGDEQQRARNVP